MDKASRMLVLVEGANIDFRLMEHLLHIYGIDNSHEVVSYNTNIYVLYKTGAELVGKLEGGTIWKVIDYLLMKLCLGMSF